MNTKLLLLGILGMLLLVVGAFSWAEHHYLHRDWINTTIAAPIQYYRSQDFSQGIIYGSNETLPDPQPLTVYSNQHDDEKKQDQREYGN